MYNIYNRVRVQVALDGVVSKMKLWSNYFLTDTRCRIKMKFDDFKVPVRGYTR